MPIAYAHEIHKFSEGNGLKFRNLNQSKSCYCFTRETESKPAHACLKTALQHSNKFKEKQGDGFKIF